MKQQAEITFTATERAPLYVTFASQDELRWDRGVLFYFDLDTQESWTWPSHAIASVHTVVVAE